MNKQEAKELLIKELNKFRKFEYSELKELIGTDPYTTDFETGNGNLYQLEIEVFWDDKPNGNIRVNGAVDDGGWRTFFPMTESFIMSSTVKFVDE